MAPRTTINWAAISKIASMQHGAFSLQQAKEYGFRARQLVAAQAKGLLFRPLSDVFTFTSHRACLRQRCMTASLVGAVISHDSAAMLHHLDGFDECDDMVVHATFDRNHKRDLAGFQVHSWRHPTRRDIIVVDGIRTTSVARTLVQLGLNHDRERVDDALESALRSGASPRWIEDTLTRLRRPGPTGQQVLEEIIYDPARSGELTESMLERVVERAMRDPALPTPRRQFEVQLESGIRRLDLAFPNALLGVEAHSRQIHFGPQADQADNVRDLQLAAAGWEVIYITSGMAQNPELFMRWLKQTYNRRRKLLRDAG